jgi:hypothetical protein
MLGATSAQAQSGSMAQLCKTVPCIYDAQNVLVGIASPQQGQPVSAGGTGPLGVVMRKVGGVWYQLNFFSDGPSNGLLYFETPHARANRGST